MSTVYVFLIGCLLIQVNLNNLCSMYFVEIKQWSYKETILDCDPTPATTLHISDSQPPVPGLLFLDLLLLAEPDSCPWTVLGPTVVGRTRLKPT